MQPGAYRQLAAVEEQHWWYRGMRRTAVALGFDGPPRPAGSPSSATGASAATGAPILVLDAGCATGGFLRQLDSQLGGTRGIGVDLHPGSLTYARRNGTPVARASVLALPFPDGTFDAVTSIDVIYHLSVTGDVDALAEMARVLKPGGRCVVQVPAFDWLRGDHDRVVHTRERYTVTKLAERLASAGLTVRRVTYANAVSLPVAVIWRGLSRLIGVIGDGDEPGSSDLAVPPQWANQLAEAALAVERAWLRRRDLPAGLSVIGVAERPRDPEARAEIGARAVGAYPLHSPHPHRPVSRRPLMPWDPCRTWS